MRRKKTHEFHCNTEYIIPVLSEIGPGATWILQTGYMGKQVSVVSIERCRKHPDSENMGKQMTKREGI